MTGAPDVRSAFTVERLEVTRVLVVEDDEETRALLCYLLRHDGMGCLEARTGEEGVQLAREHHPDLILMDLQMPFLDGREALALIRGDAAIAATPVVVLTVQDLSREDAVAGGFDGCMTKPIDPFTFNQEVAGFLPLRPLVDPAWTGTT